MDYEVKKNIKFKINNFFYHLGMPKWYIAKRTIEDNMIVFALSGAGFYQINGIDYPVKPGRIFLVTHGVVHSARQEEQNPVAVLVIRFTILQSDFDAKIDSVFQSPYYDCQQSNMFQNLFITIYRLFLIMKNTDSKDSSVYDEAASDILGSVFSLIHTDNLIQQCNRYPLLCQQIDDWIELMLHKGIQIKKSDLEKQFALTSYQLSNLCKKYYHATFKKYVAQKRIQYGQKLLLETTLSIEKIAESCGYSDAYIFSNQFKSAFGHSPNYSRRIIGKNPYQ